MNCDRRLLSDYLDGELPSDLEREVAQHITTCESCRQAIQEYRRLGRELRQIPLQPVPATVEARIRDRLGARRRPPLEAFFGSLFARPLVPALGTLAAALLIVFAVTFQQIQTDEPKVVDASLQDGGIDVVFDRPVDASTAQWQFMIDPPADVKATVIGNKVELRPEQPLQPDTRYVVIVEQRKPTSGVAAIPAVAAIEPRQPPVQINFSTGDAVAEVKPTSSPTPQKRASPTPGTTPTSVAIVAVAPPATTTPTSRATPVVVLPPTATAKPSPTVPLDACMSDVNASIAHLLGSYPDAARRLVCAVAPADTPTVTQQTFARGIVISIGRDESYVLSTGPNPSDQTWTGYGAKARVKTPTATPTAAAAATVAAATGTPTSAATPGATITPGTTVTPGTTASPDAQSPVATSAGLSAATPTATPSPAPTATPTVVVTPGPTDTPLAATTPTTTPAAGKLTPTPTQPAIGQGVRRVFGEPADAVDALGTPVTSETKQPAIVQDLAGGTVIAFGDSEAYVLLADGHWDRVVAPVTPEPAREATATPSPAPRRSPAAVAPTATPTPVAPTTPPTSTPTPAK